MQSESLESYVQAVRSKVIVGGIMSPKQLPFDFCIPDGRDFSYYNSQQKTKHVWTLNVHIALQYVASYQKECIWQFNWICWKTV